MVNGDGDVPMAGKTIYFFLAVLYGLTFIASLCIVYIRYKGRNCEKKKQIFMWKVYTGLALQLAVAQLCKGVTPNTTARVLDFILSNSFFLPFIWVFWLSLQPAIRVAFPTYSDRIQIVGRFVLGAGAVAMVISICLAIGFDNTFYIDWGASMVAIFISATIVVAIACGVKFLKLYRQNRKDSPTGSQDPRHIVLLATIKVYFLKVFLGCVLCTIQLPLFIASHFDDNSSGSMVSEPVLVPEWSRTGTTAAKSTQVYLFSMFIIFFLAMVWDDLRRPDEIICCGRSHARVETDASIDSEPPIIVIRDLVTEDNDDQTKITTTVAVTMKEEVAGVDGIEVSNTEMSLMTGGVTVERDEDSQLTRLAPLRERSREHTQTQISRQQVISTTVM